MPVKFETLVRPFQTLQSSPAPISPVAPTPSPDGPKTVTFEWGKGGGSIQSMKWTYSLTVRNYMTKQQREKDTAKTGDGDGSVKDQGDGDTINSNFDPNINPGEQTG